MTSANKTPGNWPAALKMADDVETVAMLALERILDLVGSEYVADGMVMGREAKIREAIALLEAGEADRALAVLKGG